MSNLNFRCRAWAALTLVASMAGCAITLERPTEPFDSKVIEVAPNAWYESCVNLDQGDRLLFSYVTDPPMTFSIRRHLKNADVSYIVRDRAREDGGLFLVPEAGGYCLHWAPNIAPEVTWPSLLKYSIRLNNPQPNGPSAPNNSPAGVPDRTPTDWLGNTLPR